MDAQSSASVQLPPFSSGHQYWQHRNDFVKREQMYSDQPHPPKTESDDSMPSTSDFVKKLYKFVLRSYIYSPLTSQNAGGPVLPARRLLGPSGRLLRSQRYE